MFTLIIYRAQGIGTIITPSSRIESKFNFVRCNYLLLNCHSYKNCHFDLSFLRFINIWTFVNNNSCKIRCHSSCLEYRGGFVKHLSPT